MTAQLACVLFTRVNFGYATGEDVRLNVIKLLAHTQVEASEPQGASHEFGNILVARQFGLDLFLWTSQSRPTLRWSWCAFVCGCVCCVCIRLPAVPWTPQACDLLARTWFIHLKSFNLMGYILSKHCLINCGPCTLFLVRPIVLQGDTRINTHGAKRLC